MSKKTERANAEEGSTATEAPPLPGHRVAYHDGPAEIGFAGRRWRKGVPQEITNAERASMSRRAGWVIHGFRAASV
jgi:hypothetical protein